MKLKVVNGVVRYYIKTGKDISISSMPEESAKAFLADAKKDTFRKGFEIRAGERVFEGTFEERTKNESPLHRFH